MLLLCLARSRAAPAGAEPDAKAELTSHAASLKDRAWPQPLIELYLGNATPQAVYAAIGGSEALQRQQTCQSDFFVGALHLQQGNRERAIESLRAAKDACPANFYEHLAAVAELGRLGQ